MRSLDLGPTHVCNPCRCHGAVFLAHIYRDTPVCFSRPVLIENIKHDNGGSVPEVSTPEVYHKSLYSFFRACPRQAMEVGPREYFIIISELTSCVKEAAGHSHFGRVFERTLPLEVKVSNNRSVRQTAAVSDTQGIDF